MSLFLMLKNKQFLKQRDWIESLTECGGYSQVGIGMIAQLQKVIYETYKAGYQDGKKSKKTVRSRKRTSGSRVLR
jgi:hypothetical protein